MKNSSPPVLMTYLGLLAYLALYAEKNIKIFHQLRLKLNTLTQHSSRPRSPLSHWHESG